MKIPVFIILLLNNGIVYAQFSEYTFLKRDSNIFLLWNSSSNYDSLFEKFNRLQVSGKEQIKILHIGDSHIQAEIFTNQIRKLFAENFFHLIGPPSIGFPYGLLKSNQPITVKVECTGQWIAFTSNQKNNKSVTGLSAFTTDSCAHKIFISINKKVLPNTTFNRVKIITNNDTIRKLNNPLIEQKIYYNFNDTVIVQKLLLKQYVDSIILNLKLDSNSNKFHLYGIILENEDPGIVYHTIGINGAKATTFINSYLADFINFEKYNWLIISLGTNDAYVTKLDSIEVKESFKKLINQIKQKNPQIAILLTTPMEHFYKRKYLNTNVLYIRKIIFEIAKLENCAVWDLYTIAGGEGSINQWNINNLTKADKLHLNTQGYNLLGNLFFEAFMNTYLNGFLEK